jgi:hypothetical protein
MIPANAQNEFKSLLDSKSVTGWHTYGKSTVEMHGKLKMALYILIQQQKTIKGRFSH